MLRANVHVKTVDKNNIRLECGFPERSSYRWLENDRQVNTGDTENWKGIQTEEKSIE
jgi:hypothetical protein